MRKTLIILTAVLLLTVLILVSFWLIQTFRQQETIPEYGILVQEDPLCRHCIYL